MVGRSLEPWYGLPLSTPRSPVPDLQGAGAPALAAGLRATSRYLLRAVLSGLPSLKVDILGGVILAAIDDANIGHLDTDPALGKRYARYDEAPPNGYRRPVSIQAVADRLNLPYETTRRRVEDLIVSGRCRKVRQGVYVPTLNDPAHRSNAQANYVAVRTLLRDVQTLATEVDWPIAPGFETASADPPLRLVFRRSVAFGIDAIAAFAAVSGGYNRALVYMAVLEAGGRSNPDEPVKALSRSALARSLNVPIPSARRRLLALAEDGLISAIGGGYVAVPAPDVEARIMSLARQNLQRVHRLFAELATLEAALGL